jgi:hypothetical protein|nr:MAG TPA: hypothetical protein [Caudoviricetes sp.]
MEAIINTETTVTVGGKPVNTFIKMVANAAHVVLTEQSLVRQQHGLPDYTFEDSEIYLHEILNLLND